MKKDKKAEGCPISSIGGQALMEGVMMQSPSGYAIAVRKASGEVASEYTPYIAPSKRNKFYGLPIVRGCVSFVGSLVLGTKTMLRAVEMLDLDEEEQPSKFEIWLSAKMGKNIEEIIIGVAVVIAIALACLLFVVLPSFAGAFVGMFTKNQLLLNTAEGVSRIVIFVLYLVAISQMKDIKRVFAYHGAEHKTIACYEAQEELTVENAKKHTRFHARCGTNYLFLVMMVSILFFSLLGYTGPVWGKIALRLVCLPLVAGLSYEVLKWAAKGNGIVSRIVRYPGLKLQHLTTKEPDEQMLEVAITSFKIALEPDKYPNKVVDEQPQKENAGNGESKDGVASVSMQ